jgi:hypothetical protein
MTGPEHYQEAERLAADAMACNRDEDQELRTSMFADAQVHATLAGVAAAMQPQLGGSYQLDAAWREVLGVPES